MTLSIQTLKTLSSDYFALLLFLDCFYLLSLSRLQSCLYREHLGGALVLSSSRFCGKISLKSLEGTVLEHYLHFFSPSSNFRSPLCSLPQEVTSVLGEMEGVQRTSHATDSWTLKTRIPLLSLPLAAANISKHARALPWPISLGSQLNVSI